MFTYRRNRHFQEKRRITNEYTAFCRIQNLVCRFRQNLTLRGERKSWITVCLMGPLYRSETGDRA